MAFSDPTIAIIDKYVIASEIESGGKKIINQQEAREYEDALAHTTRDITACWMLKNKCPERRALSGLRVARFQDYDWKSVLNSVDDQYLEVKLCANGIEISGDRGEFALQNYCYLVAAGKADYYLDHLALDPKDISKDVIGMFPHHSVLAATAPETDRNNLFDVAENEKREAANAVVNYCMKTPVSGIDIPESGIVVGQYNVPPLGICSNDKPVYLHVDGKLYLEVWIGERFTSRPYMVPLENAKQALIKIAEATARREYAKNLRQLPETPEIGKLLSGSYYVGLRKYFQRTGQNDQKSLWLNSGTPLVPMFTEEALAA